MSGKTIDDLGLSPVAEKAARLLLAAHPEVVFLSGRRDAAHQAHAMASHASGLMVKWIRETYAGSLARSVAVAAIERDAAIIQATVGGTLEPALGQLTPLELRAMSHHATGDAFDLVPLTGDLGGAVQSTIEHLPGLRKFITSEGGLTIWHVEF